VNQERFIRERETDWKRLEKLLTTTKKKNEPRPDDEAFPALYRSICHDLALARSRLYSRQLIDQLNHLVAMGHQRLYQARPTPALAIIHYLGGGFARSIRKQWRFVLASALLFYLPFAIMLAVPQFYPDFVYTVLDDETLRSVESMYDPADRESVGRDWTRKSDTDLMMFGFYIQNNTGIGFRTFAGGLLGGIGSMFFLLFNGFYIGAVAGHLTQIGYTETFWAFVAGHSALELNAIVFSGAAGLMLGYALLAPGRRSRMRALREEAQKAVEIMYGTALMFFLAAMVEAFWSPSQLFPPESKYVVGGILWFLLLMYFIFGGRRYAAR
jgi:uncharacterized membrane protein SpoIIM required for sporulation